mmetsp:Transcript_1678/g.3595  ORF Transcript_1678/g.3595 Transcript_1678/m.3595 type:complete len:185 (+) Transcript_1678:952-1506(+)
MSKFGKKFRILKAIDRQDILLLRRLMTDQKFKVTDEVDKSRYNMLHYACHTGNMMMANYFVTTLRMSVNSPNPLTYQTCVHRAVRGAHYEMVVWLVEQGARCFETDAEFGRTPLDHCRVMLQKREYMNLWPNLRKIQDFLLGKYADEMRFTERRKFIFIWKKARGDPLLRGLTYGLALEITQFI